jgi:hypothetical protein
VVALAGGAPITDVRDRRLRQLIGSDGALVRVDRLTINDDIIDFGP